MLTSKDIRLLVNSFKTREEADADIQALREEMHQLRLDVLEKLDAVFTEVKDMRQEQDIHVQKHRDINDRFDKLEASVNSV